MKRPIWLNLVFSLSLLFFVTGVISGGGCLFIRRLLELSLTYQETDIASTSFTSADSRQQLTEDMNEKIKEFDEIKALLSNASYINLIVTFGAVKICLAFGFLVGAILLFQFRKRGLDILKVIVFLDIIITLSPEAFSKPLLGANLANDGSYWGLLLFIALDILMLALLRRGARDFASKLAQS